MKKAIKTGLFWIASNQKIITEKKIRSEKVIIEAKVYDIVCEMNYYMARLELKEKFIFDFMIQTAKLHGFNTENTKKLLNFHYFTKQNTVNKLSTNNTRRKKSLEDKYRHISR